MAGNLTAMIASIFSGSAVTADPYFEYTTLLLPGNGTNGAQNNTFLDGSTNNFTITRNGNTTQGTFSPFSQTGWGNYFNGSSVLLNTTTASSGFNLSTGSFTIEGWVYLTSVTSYQYLINLANTAGAVSGLVFGINSSGQPYIGNGVVLGKSGSTAISANTWTHIAVVSDGTNIQFYTNGSSNGSAQAFSPNSAQYFYVGRDATGSNALTGYISNLRVTKGRAVYSGSSYDVPTSSLTRTTGGSNPPQGTECSLLTCQSNRFLDSNGVNVPASSPLTITTTGSPTAVAFSPFNPTASWSAATNGGSGYFDGSGDYLTVTSADAFDMTGDFTVELWVYPITLNTPTGASVFCCGNTSLFQFNTLASGTRIEWYANGPATISVSYAGYLQINQWNHLVACRTGTTMAIFVNGTRLGTATDNTSYNLSQLYLSYQPTSAHPFHGYMGGMRVIKGNGPYDATSSTLTVPTAPLTAITNTTLLLNFTNAGIYDATSKNDLETVGNAQISTTQSKWGGSSMYFDGTGDYVTSYNANALFRIGNIYTIELWFYTTTIAAGAAGLICLATGASTNSGINIYRSGSEIICNDGATGGTGPSSGSSAITANTWAHLAVVSDGSTTKMYIDGVLKGTYSGTTASSAALTYVTVGANGDKSSVLNGYIQDARITKGIARYTTNFTPPTAAFPTL
jgi:hypothetical protein